MIALVLALAAQAADLDRYPRQAPVTLPAEGAVRIEVPPELRTVADPGDATDLLLVDGNGDPVPIVRLDTAPRWDVSSLSRTSLTPTDTPNTWTVDVGLRPADALRIDLPRAPLAATVTVTDRAGEVIGGPTLIWRLRDSRSAEIPITPTAGPLTLTLDVHGDGRWLEPEVEALRLRDPGVEPDRLTVEVSSWRVQENGWTRYEVVLPRPLPVRALVLEPVEDVLTRQASVAASPAEPSPGTLLQELWPVGPGPIERVRLGDVAVEQLRVPVPAVDDQLAVLVDSDGKPPLEIPTVQVELPGVQLVVLDPGAGPHTLYGGAPPGTSTAWDLSAAAPELARAAEVVVEPGPVGANPAWVPPEVRANLVAPSSELDLDGFRQRAAVEGEGLVRIGLTDEVLAHARADLGDLRLVTADGRQLPYLLRRRGGEHAWPAVAWTRTERGGTSIFEIDLPYDDVPVSSVHLATSAPLFDRPVTVARPRGTWLETLRALRWIGTDRPSALSLEVEQRVGRTLVVTIDNADDPPLPIDGIEVRWPAWELIAVLPDEPVTLYWGDTSRQAPSYDLTLLRDELRHRATAAATLGDPEPVAATPLSFLDRVLLGVGIGVLALGLLGLLLSLLRATPDEADADTAA